MQLAKSIDTLVTWINEGSPLGNEEDLPEFPGFADGWMIEKPDVVFSMPEEFTVPATGTVEYKYFVTPTNFKEEISIEFCAGYLKEQELSNDVALASCQFHSLLF